MVKNPWVPCCVFVLIACVCGYAQDNKTSEVALTIYNENFAVVKERRLMDFQQGVNTTRFTDVAERIDPTSVRFHAVDRPDAVKVLEQNYAYDLADTESILKRYLDRRIQVQIKGSGARPGTWMDGKLSSMGGGDLILMDEKSGELKIIKRESLEHISLTEMPEDLVTRPTLVWKSWAKEEANDLLCQISYMTEAINWRADYTAVLNEADDQMDLSAWVTVDNQSGATYKDATLKLVAGDVRRERPQMEMMKGGRGRAMMMDMAEPQGFEEKAFMDYHLYTLGRKTTLQNRQVKQIELMPPAAGADIEKVYVYQVSPQRWLRKSEKVQINIEFENRKENQLGMALPKGKVRVFKRDEADGMLEFVGEDTIDHTAAKEKVSLYIGDAFDITPEDKIVDSKNSSRYMMQRHQISLRNRKEESVTIYVDELCPKQWNMRIQNNSMDYEMKDAYRARFSVPVGAEGEAILEYTVTYTW